MKKLLILALVFSLSSCSSMVGFLNSTEQLLNETRRLFSDNNSAPKKEMCHPDVATQPPDTAQISNLI